MLSRRRLEQVKQTTSDMVKNSANSLAEVERQVTLMTINTLVKRLSAKPVSPCWPSMYKNRPVCVLGKKKQQ